jgi:hypothetical protein
MRSFHLVLCCGLAWSGVPAMADNISANTGSGTLTNPSLSVRVRNAAGATLASQSGAGKVELTYSAAYQPGDTIVINAPPQDKHLIIQVDNRVLATMVYSPTAQVSFPVPFGGVTVEYDPLAFKGTSHTIRARVATLAEIAAYRNVAMNSIDQRGISAYYPHAVASSVTRNEPQFFERNAIDGVTQNKKHGHWPYESWGNGKNPDPWLKIDFGRDVTVDKVRLYIRADFPHDSYWTSATIQFPDGTKKDISLRKTSDPQEYAFPAKTIRWIELTNFKQPIQPLGWAAVTEMEVYGKDAPSPQR